MLREVGEAFCNDRKAKNEAISRIAFHPSDDFVGDRLRRADEGGTRRCDIECDLAQREAFILRRLLDAIRCGPEVVAADIAQFGEGLVQGIDTEVVMIEEPAEVEQRLLDCHETADGLIPGLGLFLARTDDRANTWVNADFLAWASMSDDAVLELAIENPGILEWTAIGEDRIGVLAGQPDTGIGRTCLKDDWLALPRTTDIQRPFDTEEAAVMIETVHLRGINIDALLAVAHEGIVAPGIP